MLVIYLWVIMLIRNEKNYDMLLGILVLNFILYISLPTFGWISIVLFVFNILWIILLIEYKLYQRHKAVEPTIIEKVSQDGLALRHASLKQRNDKKVVLAAVKNHIGAF